MKNVTKLLLGVAFVAGVASLNIHANSAIDLKFLQAVGNNGSLSQLRQLIQQGANVNSEYSAYGDTALILAIANNNYDIAEFLISYGANVNHGHRNDSKPLYFAVLEGNLPMVRLLVENGADTSISIMKFGTLANLARLKGFTDVANYLEQNS